MLWYVPTKRFVALLSCRLRDALAYLEISLSSLSLITGSGILKLATNCSRLLESLVFAIALGRFFYLSF